VPPAWFAAALHGYSNQNNPFIPLGDVLSTHRSQQMPTISYNSHRVTSGANETLLQACTRQGVSLRFSCRGGICQTCVMR
jgi:hypothetical protein